MITIKEYAQAHSVSLQAIYQQINRKANKQALEGHISQDEYGLKTLDDYAVEYLEKKSLKKNSTAVIVQSDSELAQKIKEKDFEIANLNTLVANMESKYLKEINELNSKHSAKIEELNKEHSTKVDELQHDRYRLLNENKDYEIQLTKANSDITIKEQTNQHLQNDLSRATSENQELKEKLEETLKQLEAEKNKGFWARLFGK